MNSKQFYDHVVKMRELQKKYFKSRQSHDMQAAKAQEALVDKEIKRVALIFKEKEQPKLF